jgi:hypothetical protein
LPTKRCDPRADPQVRGGWNQQFSFWSAAVCEASAAALNARQAPLIFVELLRLVETTQPYLRAKMRIAGVELPSLTADHGGGHRHAQIHQPIHSP